LGNQTDGEKGPYIYTPLNKKNKGWDTKIGAKIQAVEVREMNTGDASERGKEKRKGERKRSA